MKKIILFIILAFFASCNKTRTITLKTENAEGLSNETKIKANGIEVGEIESVNLDTSGNVIIVANLKPDLNLPADSDFKIENEGLIGGKTISIVIGKSKVKLDSKSIIKLKKETSLFQNDSVKSKIENVINQISGREKSDSILIELRRLNKNLEKNKKPNG